MKRRRRGVVCRENPRAYSRSPRASWRKPAKDASLGLDHGVHGQPQFSGHKGGGTSFHGELLEGVPGLLVEIEPNGTQQSVTDMLVVFLIELLGEQGVRNRPSDPGSRRSGPRQKPAVCALPSIDPDLIRRDQAQAGRRTNLIAAARTGDLANQHDEDLLGHVVDFAAQS